GGNVSLSQLFEQVVESVVEVQGLVRQYDLFGRPYYVRVQGSGFVYNFEGQMVILTNHHVVDEASEINVTFSNGNGYAASVLESNPNADFAILQAAAPLNEFKPLEIISSTTLKVGDPVIVVGSPYGLSGSMSEGIISALDRTIIAEDVIIEEVIQTTAPLNPGNSGGPLLNYQGQVVGITTAIVEESQGIGFAISSETILNEIEEVS
ncbi:trypsin-like peptidase domain-containing protein, partial [Candidatus Bathyarchaeota archaeon]|nr:trypsin-like peptidase domain-containing protein [Candidatus Bathyarchaeota archaeon]